MAKRSQLRVFSWVPILVWVLGAAGISAYGEITIEVEAAPALPVPNLLLNPSFEEGGRRPANWTDQTGGDYKLMRHPGAGRKGAFVRVDCVRSNILTSGFVNQTVSVRPGGRYVARVWVRFHAGRAYLRLLPSSGSGSEIHRVSWLGSPLVPGFLSREMTGSSSEDEWILLASEPVQAGDDGVLTIGLGTYQERSSVDFDEAFLGEAVTELSFRVSGEPLKWVAVRDEAGNDIWGSGELNGSASLVEEKIPNLSTVSRYQIVARSMANQEVQRWYPPGAEGNGQ